MAFRRDHSPVTVIGASAAGLLAARDIARSGREVTVHERMATLDHTPRSLIVTSRMRDLLGDVAEGCIRNEITRFELHADGMVATVPLARPDLIIERSRLISDLAAQAESSGARIRTGTRFLGLEPDRAGVRLAVMNGSAKPEEVVSRHVIAADGASSTVSKAAGWSRQPTVPLLQAIVEMPPGMQADTSIVWFRPDETPYFYWLIPESDTHAALGIIGVDQRTVRRYLDGFAIEHGFSIVGYQGARIPAYESWTQPLRRVGGGRVYLAGDSGGHVKVTTIGGIVTGLRGAQAVARSIVTGSRRPLMSLRWELDTHLFIRRFLNGFTTDDYRTLLALLDDGLQQRLAENTRDEPARALALACLAQPRLFLLGLRALSKGGQIPILRPLLDRSR
jgi:flavin-dependent dehydrogenase